MRRTFSAELRTVPPRLSFRTQAHLPSQMPRYRLRPLPHRGRQLAAAPLSAAPLSAAQVEAGRRRQGPSPNLGTALRWKYPTTSSRRTAWTSTPEPPTPASLAPIRPTPRRHHCWPCHRCCCCRCWRRCFLSSQRPLVCDWAGHRVAPLAPVRARLCAPQPVTRPRQPGLAHSADQLHLRQYPSRCCPPYAAFGHLDRDRCRCRSHWTHQADEHPSGPTTQQPCLGNACEALATSPPRG